MLLFVVEIIIMILAIILGLRTAGALGCGIFAIVAQLIMILVFSCLQVQRLSLQF